LRFVCRKSSVSPLAVASREERMVTTCWVRWRGEEGACRKDGRCVDRWKMMNSCRDSWRMDSLAVSQAVRRMFIPTRRGLWLKRRAPLKAMRVTGKARQARTQAGRHLSPAQPCRKLCSWAPGSTTSTRVRLGEARVWAAFPAQHSLDWA
jgi:hypothetical protein